MQRQGTSYVMPPGFQPVPGQPWVVTLGPRRPATVTKYKHHQSVYLGVALIISGCLSIVFNIVELAVEHNSIYTNKHGINTWDTESLSFIGHGLWSGVMCVVAGCLGVAAGHKRSVSMIRGFYIMCILVAVGCMAQFIIAAVGADNIVRNYSSGDYFCCTKSCSYISLNYGWNGEGSIRRNPPEEFCREWRTVIAMTSLIAVTAAIGGIAAVWAAVLGCKVACCCDCCGCDDPNPPMFQNGQIQMTLLAPQGSGVAAAQMIPLMYTAQNPNFLPAGGAHAQPPGYHQLAPATTVPYGQPTTSLTMASPQVASTLNPPPYTNN